MSEHHPHHREHGAGQDGFEKRTGRERGGRGPRVFAPGDLKLLLLALIAEQPCHGYDLIRQIEGLFDGAYSPSPGVIYPTLTLLEELGYTTMDESDGGRKRYTITPAGHTFLEENRAAADAMLARMQDASSPHTGRPPQIVRALENFKMAVRLRLAAPLTEEQAHAFAQVLDQAAQNLERL